MPNTVIVGCGDVGIRLAGRLIKTGHQVWGMRRSVEKLPAFINAIKMDLTDAAPFSNLPENIDTVIYCAAAGGGGELNYRQVYVEGLRKLLAQLCNEYQSLPDIIFTSSTSVYGQNNGEWVNEDSATEPERYSGKIMLEAEALLAQSVFSYSIVRFGGIYGPGRNHLIGQVKNSKATVTRNCLHYTNRIHADDCAGVLAHILTLAEPENCYLAVDNELVDKAELVDWLACKLNVSKPERVNQLDGETVRNKRCQNTRLLRSGYQFIYPGYRDGYSSLLRSL